MTNKKYNTLTRILASIIDYLTIVFCALRACNVIHWSWYWVLAPMIISAIMLIVCFSLNGMIAAVENSADSAGTANKNNKYGGE